MRVTGGVLWGLWVWVAHRREGMCDHARQWGNCLTQGDDHTVGTDPAEKRAQGPRFPLRQYKLEERQRKERQMKQTKLKGQW